MILIHVGDCRYSASQTVARLPSVRKSASCAAFTAALTVGIVKTWVRPVDSRASSASAKGRQEKESSTSTQSLMANIRGDGQTPSGPPPQSCSCISHKCSVRIGWWSFSGEMVLYLIGIVRGGIEKAKLDLSVDSKAEMYIMCRM
jgi:hypothetical protein